mgnify:CR=1 FL=1
MPLRAFIDSDGKDPKLAKSTKKMGLNALTGIY